VPIAIIIVPIAVQSILGEYNKALKKLNINIPL
jgi:hypothetical protein